MRNLINSFAIQDSGATSIEYALIAGFIGLAIITTVLNIGTELSSTFTDVQTGLQKRAKV
ncbi:MAG: Flp family type IVb pilin [Proteobacteria bacterium]|nr:Flp family type IVb pilin [Pseudomonadota bacterium]